MYTSIMKKIKYVVFLDIDGVLNNRNSMYLAMKGFYPPKNARIYTMDTGCVQIFKLLLEETGAKFVISSSWRKGAVSECTRVFNALEWCGFPNAKEYCVGVTSRLVGGRGSEIDHWLSTHDVDNFVILDDDSFDITQLQNFVRTEHESGITVQNLLTAKKILEFTNDDSF